MRNTNSYFIPSVRPFVSEVQTLHRKVYFVDKPIFCGIKNLLICFWTNKQFWHEKLTSRLTISLKMFSEMAWLAKWHWCGSVCDFIFIGIARILRVKMFPGDSEEERPRGLGRIWGVKACQGVEKDDGGVTSRFNCLHKTGHTLLTNGNISKRGIKGGVFVPFLFVFLCFPLQSFSDKALIYDSTSSGGEKGNQLELMWLILESSTLRQSFRREGGDLANQ